MTKKKRVAVLVTLFLLALFLRSYRLGSVGLSEDESNKILATQKYRQGDFTANGEHPLLMKLFCTASLIVTDRWNALVPSLFVSPEAALRFPLALAGSLAVLALYFLGNELFGSTIGLIAATLWAVEINSVALSRIAKEDPLLILFFILGNFFLLRGKRMHSQYPAKAQSSYLACGASFGAMFASKYLVPFPWITLLYYDLFRFKKEPRWRIDRKTLILLYASFAGAFLLLNFEIMTPGIVRYGWQHFTQRALTHHGYYMMGRLYLNTAIQTLWGVPVYYYLLYIFVKTPIPLLIFLAVGLTYSVKNFRQDNFLFVSMYFVLWTILLSLPGGKFTRYVMTLLPAIILLEAVGIVLVYELIRSYTKKRYRSASVATAGLVLMLLGTAGWQCVLNWKFIPNQSFYVSEQGGGEARWGYYFPQDEIYDAGLREALQYLCKTAPQTSTVLGTTPAVFEYYTGVYGRKDLKFISMAGMVGQFPKDPRVYVLYQDYRRYIENNYFLDFAYSQLRPLYTGDVKGVSVVSLFFFSRDPKFAKAPFWKARQWPGLLAKVADSQGKGL
jgi:hypothetical protein